jgi:Tfp pilus assembly protein PilN
MAVLLAIAALFVVWVFYVQRSARQQAELLLSTNINIG